MFSNFWSFVGAALHPLSDQLQQLPGEAPGPAEVAGGDVTHTHARASHTWDGVLEEGGGGGVGGYRSSRSFLLARMASARTSSSSSPMFDHPILEGTAAEPSRRPRPPSLPPANHVASHPRLSVLVSAPAT